MQKRTFLIIGIIALGLIAIVYGGIVDSRTVYFSSTSYAEFDTVEVCTSSTYEVGKSTDNPDYLRFMTSITTTIDSVDTIYAIANMDISPDGATWFDYCDIDTFEQDTAVAGTTVYYSDAITVPDCRYYRIRLSNATNDSLARATFKQIWRYTNIDK